MTNPSVSGDYFVWVVNHCGEAESDVATVRVVGEPQIDGPADTIACPVSIADPSVRATLTPTVNPQPYTLYWYELVADQPSIDLNTHTPSLTVTHPGQYFAWAYNLDGPAISRLVNVAPSPGLPQVAIVESGAQSVRTGDSVTWTATASNYDVIEWFAAGGSSPIATGSTLTVAPTATATYTAQARNRCSIAKATARTWTCNASPTPRIGAFSRLVIRAGTSFLLYTSTDETNSAVRYDWYSLKPGEPSHFIVSQRVAPGATSNQTPPISVQPTTRTQYFYWATNACGSAISPSITLEMKDGAMAITSSTPDQTITAGESVTITTTVSGPQPTAFKWYRYDPTRECELVGTSASLTVSPTTTSQYFAWFFNSEGQISTPMVTITVK